MRELVASEIEQVNGAGWQADFMSLSGAIGGGVRASGVMATAGATNLEIGVAAGAGAAVGVALGASFVVGYIAGTWIYRNLIIG